MPRARNIKPGFFHNPDLADISPYGRLLFIGLWTIADRSGRLEDRPRNIKFELFPVDSIDVETELNALSSKGFLIRYEHDGVRYLQVVNFDKHQNPHSKEPASTIPAPCLTDASTIPAVLIPDSGFLIPDSGFLNTGVTSRDRGVTARDVTPRTEQKREEDIHAPDGANEQNGLTAMDGGNASPKPIERRFNRFWHVYPKKRSKQDAWKVWQRLNPDDALTDRMVASIAALRRTQDWKKQDGQFIPYPASWLNAGGWDDETVVQLRGDHDEKPGYEAWWDRPTVTAG